MYAILVEELFGNNAVLRMAITQAYFEVEHSKKYFSCSEGVLDLEKIEKKIFALTFLPAIPGFHIN